MLKFRRDLKENRFAAESGSLELLESVAGNLLNKILPILITSLIAFCFIELFWAEKGPLAVGPPLVALLLSLVANFYLCRGKNLLAARIIICVFVLAILLEVAVYHSIRAVGVTSAMIIALTWACQFMPRRIAIGLLVATILFNTIITILITKGILVEKLAASPVPALLVSSVAFTLLFISILAPIQLLYESAAASRLDREKLHKTLEELQLSRSFTIQAADNSRQLFGWLAPDGMAQYANNTALSAIGATIDDVKGKFLWETPWFAHDPQSQSKLREAILRAAAGESIRYDTILPTSSGECREIDFSIHPIVDESGVVTMLVAEGQDVTVERQTQMEKEKLKDRLSQAQKIESVGLLAGGVAHDFNNMLGVILGNAELGMISLATSEPAFANLQEIHNAANRSADITRQLLAFARKQEIAPQVLDLNETIGQMIKMLRRLLGENIDFSWKPGFGLWQVKMDPSQLDQTLVNLCVNARDAMKDAGQLLIETKNATIDESFCANHPHLTPGDYVLLAVSDNGCGMGKEVMEHLFEPFYTTKMVGKGTGLGLATVYGIVKQNKGHIEVYSESGIGTTFKIFLPRQIDVEKSSRKEQREEATQGGNETILLVEDEQMILDMATKLLKKLGYTILIAKTPGEALRLTKEYEGKIDLLLTDVIMPEMNGRDLAKLLMSLKPDLKTIFMSGYTANVIASQGVIDEGVLFIQKPFTIAELATKIRMALF